MLRLRIDEADRRRILELLRAASGQEAGRAKTISSACFDTPRGKLLRAGYRLCARVQEPAQVQYNDAAGSASLSPVAPCWTRDIDDDAPADNRGTTALADKVLGEKDLRKLQPVVGIDIRRRSAILNRNGAGIVASLDTGTIAAGGAVERICELRLELVSGAPASLCDVARELCAAIAATPTLRSHCEKGFRLLHMQPDHPRHVSLDDLRDGMTTREAANSISWSCVAGLFDDLALLRSAGGGDVLHRSRISLRRLRAVLWFLRPVLSLETAALSRQLRALAQFLGRARELDVFCDRVLVPLRLAHPAAPGVDALVDIFEQRRREALDEVRTYGRSPAMLEFGVALVEGLVAVSCLRAASIRHSKRLDRPVVEYVNARLHRRLQAFLKASNHLESSAPDRQHDIRVDAKKLRYAIEAFHPIIGFKRSGQLMSRLTRMQDHLGELNDARIGHAIAVAYAEEKTRDGNGASTLFAAGLAAAACLPDPTSRLVMAAAARDGLASLARQ